MPGRATRGGRRTTAASKQASSRKSKDAEITPPQTANAEPATALQRTIRNSFASAQNTTATHRKLVVTLRSLQEENAGKGRPAEDDFNQEFVRCLSRALAVKKGENAADRILRFCNMFVRHIHEKELKARQEAKRAAKLAQGIPDEDVEMEDEEEEEEEEEIPATFTTRFTAYVLKFLVKGLDAANKTVRYRICQFLALILKDISAMDETVWKSLKQGLVKRLLDREAAVRSQASLALVKMGFGIIEEEEESEEDSDDDEEKPVGGVVGRLVDRLSNDPSADVRRSILLNLNHSPLTLPHLLERARDTEALTRRLVYSRTLPALGDFRLLSISMREKILRWGLEDRDPNVRKAAERTFAESWVGNANGDLLEVLERLDVVNSKVAELAMESFWKQGTGTEVEFTHDFWQNLTAEAAFLARTFNDYCRDPQTKFDHHIDEKIPEVTHLAFVVQKYINLLVESPEGVPLSQSQNGAQQLDSSELEFIVEQLLLIALKLDYGDEIGRRKMFALLRESLALVDLPDGTVKRIVEVIRKLSGGEREFCSVILEIIAEVHDTISPPEEEGEDGEDAEGEESFHSATSDLEDEGGARKKKKKPKKKAPADGDEEMADADDEDAEEKAIKEMVTNMKCLYIAQCMLENVEGDLNSNAHLVTMLNGLVVPAVRSQEAPIRERGLRCLGLCCLLDKTLAEENLALFAHCFNKGHEELQIEAVQIICDILVSHGSTIFESETCTIEQKILYKMLSKAIKLDDSPDVQAAVIEVLCKLMLARVVEDEDLLKAIVVAYFDPSTIDNLSLRQILSYFLPVFCHSRDENQVRMASITAAALHTLYSMHASLDEDEVMITPAAMSAQFADWTDPRKVFGAIEGTGMAGSKINYDVHVDVANAIFERILGGGNKDEKKTFCQMLSKLYITHHATPEKLQQLYEAVVEAIEGKSVTDAVSRNALTKFEVTLGKIVSTVEEGLQNDGDITIATLRSSKGGDEEGDDDDNDGDSGDAAAVGDESVLSTITVATTRAPGDDTRVEGDEDEDEEEEEDDDDDDEEDDDDE